MKYALIGDIHSSIDDLKAVLAQIETFQPPLKIIGMGDLYECLIGKKKVHTLTAPLSLTEAQLNPAGFEDWLTFPSIRGNQEERIMRATDQSLFNNLPERVDIEGATLIHGHQFQWDRDWIPQLDFEATEPLIFFGHTHYSFLYRKGKRKPITFGEPIALKKKHYGINVGSVVDHREWVLYDAAARTVTFMKA